MEQNNQLQEQKETKKALVTYFESPAIRAKFEEILGAKRSAAFLTSLLQVANGNSTLQNANPVSIFNAAATAATLDLPINPNLGFAWIVPYQGKAQFQLGYKGLIQLAMRSGQYARINAVPVYKNQFESWNELTEDLKADFNKDPEGEVVGYVAYFRNLNGFEKMVFWSKQKVYNHAQKFSKNFNTNTSIWKTDFDSMALKTVLKTLLSKWGILSIQMEKAIQVDQAVINDPDATDWTYVDNDRTPEDKSTAATDEAFAGIRDINNKAGGK